MAKAKELFKEPDIIIDLYDFTILWMSPRLERIVDFTNHELIGKNVADTFALPVDKRREKAIEHMSKQHGFLDVDSKAKKGVVRFRVEFYTTELNKGFYHIGTMIKHTKLSK